MKRSLFSLFFLFSLSSVYGGMQDVQDRLYSMSAKEELLPARSAKWCEDFHKALTVAKEEKKQMLIAFLGTPWCPWSEKIEKEVLNEHEFVSRVSREFVMASVTLKEEGEQDVSLRERYAVDELPTFIIADEEGREITRVGYLPKGPEEFAQHLTQIRRDYVEVKQVVDREDLSMFTAKELKRLYLKAKNQGLTKLQDKLYIAGLQVDKGLFFLLEQYSHFAGKGRQDTNEAEAVRKKIIARDPKNEQGAFRSLALLDFEALSQKRLVRKRHINAALKPLVEYVKKYGDDDSENLWRIELLIAQFLYRKSQEKDALLHAKSAFNHAPEGNKAEIIETISYLENKVKKGG